MLYGDIERPAEMPGPRPPPETATSKEPEKVPGRKRKGARKGVGVTKQNGGVQRYPQPGWQSGIERKGIRVLDCESDGTSRDESRP